MFARNFHRRGMHLFLPELDWNGAEPGYTESELQLYPYLVALFYSFTGVHEWVGRALSLFFFLGSVLLVYRLLLFFVEPKWALLGALFYGTSPLTLFFSTAFMPESTMLFFMAASACAFLLLLQKRSWGNIFLFVVSTQLMLLIKIPTLFMGILYGLFLLSRRRELFREPLWWAMGVLILLPAFFWYRYAFHLGQMTGMTENIWNIGADKWGNWSIWSKPLFYRVVSERVVYQMLTPIGSFLFLLGFFAMTRDDLFFLSFFLAVLLYFFVVAYGNIVHNYYQLPLTIPLSFFVIRGVQILERALSSRFLFFAMALLFLYALSVRSAASPFYRQQLFFLKAARYVQKETEPDDLILVVDYSHPEVLYYADRRGYHLHPRENSPDEVDSFRKKGVRTLVFSPGRQLSLYPKWEKALKQWPCPHWEPSFVFCKI